MSNASRVCTLWFLINPSSKLAKEKMAVHMPPTWWGPHSRRILRPSFQSFAPAGSRSRLRVLSTSRLRFVYSDTVPNLKIGKDTRVIFQGFTGKQATQNARQSLDYGTQIVGGVTPGKSGEHLGLPVLSSVRAVSRVPCFTLINRFHLFTHPVSGQEGASTRCNGRLRCRRTGSGGH